MLISLLKGRRKDAKLNIGALAAVQRNMYGSLLQFQVTNFLVFARYYFAKALECFSLCYEKIF